MPRETAFTQIVCRTRLGSRFALFHRSPAHLPHTIIHYISLVATFLNEAYKDQERTNKVVALSVSCINQFC